MFELWTEKVKLLGNMDLVSVLAAYFHLCFIFDLKYPKVSIFKHRLYTAHSKIDRKSTLCRVFLSVSNTSLKLVHVFYLVGAYTRPLASYLLDRSKFHT